MATTIITAWTPRRDAACRLPTVIIVMYVVSSQIFFNMVATVIWESTPQCYTVYRLFAMTVAGASCQIFANTWLQSHSTTIIPPKTTPHQLASLGPAAYSLLSCTVHYHLERNYPTPLCWVFVNIKMLRYNYCKLVKKQLSNFLECVHSYFPEQWGHFWTFLFKSKHLKNCT